MYYSYQWLHMYPSQLLQALQASVGGVTASALAFTATTKQEIMPSYQIAAEAAAPRNNNIPLYYEHTSSCTRHISIRCTSRFKASATAPIKPGVEMPAAKLVFIYYFLFFD
jgi:hypothetical protein